MMEFGLFNIGRNWKSLLILKWIVWPKNTVNSSALTPVLIMTINAVLFIGALTLTLSHTEAGPRSTPSQCQADAKTCGFLYSAFKPLLRPMLPSVSPVTLTTVGLWLAHSRLYDVAASPRSMAF